MKRPRRPLTRAEILSRMPRALRPKLTRDQVRDLGIAHHEAFDAISRGEGDWQQMWNWVGGCLTWHRVAQVLQVGEPEMAIQLEVSTQLVERYGRTRRVAFDGPGLQLARQGIEVMDQLAELVDRPTAIAAAEWSDAEINRLSAAAEQLRHAA